MNELFARDSLITFTTFFETPENNKSDDAKINLLLNRLFVDDRCGERRSDIAFSLSKILNLTRSPSPGECEFSYRLSKSFIWKTKLFTSSNNKKYLILVTSSLIKCLNVSTFFADDANEELKFDELRWNLIHRDIHENWRQFDIYGQDMNSAILAVAHSDGTIEVIFAQYAERNKRSMRGRVLFQSIDSFLTSENNLKPITGLHIINETSIVLVHYSGIVDYWTMDFSDNSIKANLSNRKVFSYPIIASHFDATTEHVYLSFLGAGDGTLSSSLFQVCTLSPTNKSLDFSPRPFRGPSLFSRCTGEIESVCKMSTFQAFLICLHLNSRITLWKFPLDEPFIIIEPNDESRVVDFHAWPIPSSNLPMLLTITDQGIVTIRNIEEKSIITGCDSLPDLLFNSANIHLTPWFNEGALIIHWDQANAAEDHSSTGEVAIVKPKKLGLALSDVILSFLLYLFITFIRIFNVKRKQVEQLLPKSIAYSVDVDSSLETVEYSINASIISPTTPYNLVQKNLKMQNYEEALKIAKENAIDTVNLHKAIWKDVIDNFQSYTLEGFEKVSVENLSSIPCDQWLIQNCLDPKFCLFHQSVKADEVIQMFQHLYDILTKRIDTASTGCPMDKYAASIGIAKDCANLYDFSPYEMANFIRMLNNESVIKFFLNNLHMKRYKICNYLISKYWTSIGPHYLAILATIDSHHGLTEAISLLLEPALQKDDIQEDVDKRIDQDLFRSLYFGKSYLDEFCGTFDKAMIPKWLIEHSKAIDKKTGSIHLTIKLMTEGKRLLEMYNRPQSEYESLDLALIDAKKFEFILRNHGTPKSSILEKESQLKRVFEGTSLMNITFGRFHDHFSIGQRFALMMKSYPSANNTHDPVKSEESWNFIINKMIPWICLEPDVPKRQEEFVYFVKAFVREYSLSSLVRLVNAQAKGEKSWKSNEYHSMVECSNLDWISPVIDILLDLDLDQLTGGENQVVVNLLNDIESSIAKRNDSSPKMKSDLKLIRIYHENLNELLHIINKYNNTNSCQNLTIGSILVGSCIKTLHKGLSSSQQNDCKVVLNKICSNITQLSLKLASSYQPVRQQEPRDIFKVDIKVKGSPPTVDPVDFPKHLMEIFQDLQGFLMKIIAELMGEKTLTDRPPRETFERLNSLLYDAILKSSSVHLIEYLSNEILSTKKLSTNLSNLINVVLTSCFEYLKNSTLLTLVEGKENLLKKCLSLIECNKEKLYQNHQDDEKANYEVKLKGIQRVTNLKVFIDKLRENYDVNRLRDVAFLCNVDLYEMSKMLIDPIECVRFNQDFIRFWAELAKMDESVFCESFEASFSESVKSINRKTVNIDMPNLSIDILNVLMNMVRQEGENLLKNSLLREACQQSIVHVLETDSDHKQNWPLLFNLAYGFDYYSTLDSEEAVEDQTENHFLYFLIGDNWNGASYQLSVEMFRERILSALLASVHASLKPTVLATLEQTQKIILEKIIDSETNSVSDSDWKDLIGEGYSFIKKKITKDQHESNKENSLLDPYVSLTSHRPINQEMMKKILNQAPVEELEDDLTQAVSLSVSLPWTNDFLLLSHNPYMPSQKTWIKKLGRNLGRNTGREEERRRLLALTISSYNASNVNEPRNMAAFYDILDSRFSELCEKYTPIRVWSEKVKKDHSLSEIVKKSKSLDVDLLENDERYREEKIKEISLKDINLAIQLASEYEVNSKDVFKNKLSSLSQIATRLNAKEIDVTINGLYSLVEKNDKAMIEIIEEVYLESTLGAAFVITQTLLNAGLDPGMKINTMRFETLMELLKFAHDRNKWQSSLRVRELFSPELLKKITDQQACEVVLEFARLSNNEYTFDMVQLKLVDQSWSRIKMLKETMSEIESKENQEQLIEYEKEQLIVNLLKISQQSIISWTLENLLYYAEEKNWIAKLLKKIVLNASELKLDIAQFSEMVAIWLKHWKTLSELRSEFLSLIDSSADKSDLAEVINAWKNLPPKSKKSLVPNETWKRFCDKLLHHVALYKQNLLMLDTCQIFDSVPGICNLFEMVYKNDLSNLDKIYVHIQLLDFSLASSTICSHYHDSSGLMRQMIVRLDEFIQMQKSRGEIINYILGSNFMRRNFFSSLAIFKQTGSRRDVAEFNLNLILDPKGKLSAGEMVTIESEDLYKLGQDLLAHVDCGDPRERDEMIHNLCFSLVSAVEVMILKEIPNDKVRNLWSECFRFLIDHYPSNSLSWTLEVWRESGTGHPPDSFCSTIGRLLVEDDRTDVDRLASLSKYRESDILSCGLSLVLLSKDSSILESLSQTILKISPDTFTHIDDNAVQSGLFHHLLTIVDLPSHNLLGCLIETLLTRLNTSLYLTPELKEHLTQITCPVLFEKKRPLEALTILQKINYSPASPKRNWLVDMFKSLTH